MVEVDCPITASKKPWHLLLKLSNLLQHYHANTRQSKETLLAVQLHSTKSSANIQQVVKESCSQNSLFGSVVGFIYIATWGRVLRVAVPIVVVGRPVRVAVIVAIIPLGGWNIIALTPGGCKNTYWLVWKAGQPRLILKFSLLHFAESIPHLARCRPRDSGHRFSRL